MMPLRPLFLRGSLAGLAITIGVAIISILAGESQVAGEIIGTGFATAILFLAFFGGSFIVDRPALRVGTLASLAVFCSGWALIMLLIWSHHFTAGYYWRFEEAILVTLAVLSCVGIPAAGFLFFVSVRWLRLTTIVFASVSAAVIAALGITMLLFEHAARTEYAVLTIFLMYGMGAIASACLIGAGTPASRHARSLGVILSIAGTLLALVAGFSDEALATLLWQALACVASLALLAAQYVIVGMITLKSQQAWLRPVTLGLGWAAVMLACILALIAPTASNNTTETLSRILAAAMLASGGATLCLLVLARLNRRAEPVATPLPDTLTSLDATCPGCQRRQTLPAGASACIECGLRFDIKIIEPRCVSCGYLLYRNTTGQCPECGHEIAAALPPRPAAALTPVKPDPPPATVPVPATETVPRV